MRYEACEELEVIFKAILKDQTYRAITLVYKGVVLGVLKLKGERTFLSFTTIHGLKKYGCYGFGRVSYYSIREKVSEDDFSNNTASLEIDDTHIKAIKFQYLRDIDEEYFEVCPRTLKDLEHMLELNSSAKTTEISILYGTIKDSLHLLVSAFSNKTLGSER